MDTSKASLLSVTTKKITKISNSNFSSEVANMVSPFDLQWRPVDYDFDLEQGLSRFKVRIRVGMLICSHILDIVKGVAYI